MKLLFVADPLESFNVKKDSTFVMMKEAARRGHTLFACEPKDLMWQRGARVSSHVREIALTGGKVPWFSEFVPEAGAERTRAALADLNLERLWVVYPGAQRYPLDARVECIGLDALPEVREALQ